MISQQEAEARVARGAAHLDHVRPGWFTRLDVGTLTLWDCTRCVVGQLAALTGLGWNEAVHELFCTGVNTICLSEGGFYVGYENDEEDEDDDEPQDESSDGDLEQRYRPLQDAWINLIAARLHPAQEPERTPVADSAEILSPVRCTPEGLRDKVLS